MTDDNAQAWAHQLELECRRREEEAPQCEHWIFGGISVKEAGEIVTYHRAILLSFKTIEEFRAALKFVDPLWNK